MKQSQATRRRAITLTANCVAALEGGVIQVKRATALLRWPFWYANELSKTERRFSARWDAIVEVADHVARIDSTRAQEGGKGLADALDKRGARLYVRCNPAAQ